MKITLLLTILISFQQFALAAAGTPAAVEGGAEVESVGVIEEDSNDKIEKLLSIPAVAAKKVECENKGVSNLDKCIWDGDPTNNIAPLSDKVKEEVSKKLTMGEDEDEASNFQSVDIDNTKQKKTNTQQKLEEYLKKRLEGYLYKDKADGKVRDIADHQIFHRIQQSEISKSIINSISSYCMDAKFSTVTNAQGKQEIQINMDEADVKDNRVNNIKALSQANGAQNMEKYWSSCASQIPNFCQKGSADSSQSYKSQRACEVVSYLKGKRQELKINEEINKQWDKIADRASSDGIAVGNLNAMEDVKVDDIVNITSNEATGNDEYKDAIGEEGKILAECKTNYAAKKAECDRYLIDSKESEKLATEYALRMRGMEDKIEKNTQSDEGLKDYLKEEGYSQEKIESLTSDQNKIQALRDKIKKRYANEREAMIQSMKDKLNKRSVSQADKADPTIMQGKFDSLEKELKEESTHYKQLLHFSNIVSGYLSVGSGANAGKNTIALRRELGDSAITSSGGRGTASGPSGPDYGATYLDDLKDNTKAETGGSQPTDSNGANSATNLELDTLNDQILNYD
tara:strand:+ start:19612 stop:21327 length:1716 start_codon:yes stop_codon:yes gene_type:complete